MSSEATATLHSRADAPTTAAAVLTVLADNKATVLDQAPEAWQVDFQTKKTMFNWELLGRAVIVPANAGSDVHVSLDVHHDRPKALLDGAKNRKAHGLADHGASAHTAEDAREHVRHARSHSRRGAAS